jgi:hypothetical protein
MLDDQPRPESTEGGAIFAPVRVRATRRPRIRALLVIVAVGGLVAIGALDRGAAAPGTATVADGTNRAAASVPTPAPHSTQPRPRASAQVPVTVDAPGDGARFVDLDVRPAGGDLFIHGDVFSLDVARVTVTLEDSAGNVAATRSVDIPGGSTAFRIGSVPRFDVHFTLADEVQAHGFMVSATAIDSAGRRLTTLLQLVARSVDTR